MAWFIGIDIGSVSTKGVITNDGELQASHLIPSGGNYSTAAQKLREELLSKAGLLPDDIAGVVVTGHGVDNIPFATKKIADIRCCARGMSHLFPSVRTIIDAQGQSSQAIRLNDKGQVINVVVSEKCASGSGRFLEIIANVLQMKLEDIGPVSLESDNPVTFTTGCAVFGESEVISRISEGISKTDILAGVNKALAEKLSALVDRVGLEERCAISGGGGLNIGLIKRVEEKLGVELMVPPEPQLINALGAAVVAEEASRDPVKASLLEPVDRGQWEVDREI